VLVAAVNALFVGYLGSGRGSGIRRAARSTRSSTRLARDRRDRGRHPWSPSRPGSNRHAASGRPSGHAAVAFGGWAAVTFITQSNQNQVLVSTLVFMMALLVAQTRIEARVHTTLEVLYGGVLGAMVTAAIFQAFS
jgi:membrane-associated phospholipid phosphatase